jgi:hypothetical protein
VRLHLEKFHQISKHLEGERFAAVRDILPAFDLIEDAANRWCESLASLLSLPQVMRIRASAEGSNAKKIFFHSSGLDSAA